jgi:hypothetical protein
VVHEHPASRLIAEDTGLGKERSRNFVLLQMTTRPRTAQEKQEFYPLLCSELKASCGIEASDVMVSIVENTDAD